MARYDVQSPAKDYNGMTCKVRFYKGRGHVDSEENPAAVAYFRRRGYTLAEVREEQSEQSSGGAPAKPKAADSKDTWVAYTVATSDLTEAEAKDLTKAELIELAEADKEQS